MQPAPYQSSIDELKHITESVVENFARAHVEKLLPGFSGGQGDCFFPLFIPVRGNFRRIRVRSGDGNSRVNLEFSKIVLAGWVDGEKKLTSLEDHVTVEQSSAPNIHLKAENGVLGQAYVQNVKTRKEMAPWWEARLNDNVELRRIFLFRRYDKFISAEKFLRIEAETISGSWVTLWHANAVGAHRRYFVDDLSRGLDALIEMRASLSGQERLAYDNVLNKALSTLQRIFKEHCRPSRVKPVSSSVRAKIVGATDTLLGAVYDALGGPRDFGLTPEDGVFVKFPARKVSSIRVRVFGELPNGLGGLELFGENENKAVKSFSADDLKYRGEAVGMSDVESYRAGLVSNVKSRVVNLKLTRTVSGLRFWNSSKQDAGNHSFLEISVRESADTEWHVVHDRGAQFRHVVKILRLLNALLRDDWSPNYTRLIGKLFTQYRRRAVIKGLGKFTRDDPELNNAVFAGSKSVEKTNGFAAPLRLGKHGLGVPVAFRDSKEVMAQMTEMRDKMTAIGYPPMLMYGTLLGAIREKDFIPHDDDVDLVVIIDGAGKEDLKDLTQKAIEDFNNNGIKANKGGGPEAPLIHCHRRHVTYDVFVLGHKDGKIYWPHKALAVREERADIFLPRKPIEFKGEVFDGPADPEAVCEARYGEGWRVPDPTFEW